MNQFHLLRPEWLLALLPLMFLVWKLQSRKKHSGNLSSVCDPRLLPYLLIGERDKPGFNHNLLIGMGGILAIVALAGPSWNKLEQPLYREQSSLVILLDLSSSMNSTDIEPSRLTKARFKLLDILKRRDEGQTALIVYAAQPFVVTPLTDDSATISSLVGSLTPEIMPSQGSRPDLALQRAIELLKQSGAVNGDLLFLTDGMSDDTLHNILGARPQQYRLNAIGFGTVQGSPIPLARGGFIKDKNGSIVVDKLDEQLLQKLASEGGGVYSRLTHDDSDIDNVFTAIDSGNLAENATKTTLSSDNWQEEGPWLILLLLPLAAFVFRRGYLVLIILVLPLPQPVHALEWNDLWLRADQQAARTLAEGNPRQAANQFEDDTWRSAAHYQAGDYQQSLDALKAIDNADSNYNKGNALARLGKLQEAIGAYQQSLLQKPGDEDTQHNMDLVKKLLQQQQQQQQNQSNQEKPQAKNDEQETQQQQGGEQNQNERQASKEEQQASNDDTSDQSGEQDQPEQNDSGDQEPQNKDEPKESADQSGRSNAETDEAAANEEKQTDKGDEQSDKDQEREQESTRQWLRRVPDDPGGLLKRKFLYQYKQQFQGRSETQPW